MKITYDSFVPRKQNFFLCSKRYFILYWKLQLQNIKSLAEYRADFLMTAFFTLLSQACS